MPQKPSKSPLTSFVERHGAEPVRALLERDEDAMRALPYAWPLHARPEQLPPPGDWRTWIYLAGRGAGKTRTGAEWVRAIAERDSRARIGLIAPTAADVRDVMVRAILDCSPPDQRPDYQPSNRVLRWASGAEAHTYSAEEPDRLRGPQHGQLWADELCAWRDLETWDMALLGLRVGSNPRALITTTPRPLPVLVDLMNDPHTVTVRGSTFDNAANLAPGFLEQIVKRYEGTRLGRQELYAEILTDTPGALWTRELIRTTKAVPEMRRVVVAIDPAVSQGEDADETGIVVCGLDHQGTGYVLADHSGHYSPDGWARRALDMAAQWGADRIVAERNQGGDMVEHTIRTIDRSASLRTVTAKRSKYLRAEPVAALYEQGRVLHQGALPKLEDQMCTFVPGDPSPDRLDAMVYALTDLMLAEQAPRLTEYKPTSRRRI